MENAPSVLGPSSPVGPISRRRQLRTLAVYVALAASGAVLVAACPVVKVQAFGAGLWFPGSGFVALGGWWMPLGGLSALLFLVGLIAWFQMSLTLLPPLVWLFSAGAAAWAAREPLPDYGIFAASAIPATAALLAVVIGRRRAREVRRRRAERMAYLPERLAAVRAARAVVTVPGPQERELSAEDLSWLRYALDRALAEVGDFSLFDERLRAASVRSQLTSTGWALGVYQRHWAPNFHGYVNTGQQRVIEQYGQEPIWSYWRRENAWGNLKLNPDPVRRDNVKMVGHMMTNLVLYELNTGDDRFSAAGGVNFLQESRRCYEHSTHSFAHSLISNFGSHRTCLYPCAPNWVFTYCNLVGLAGLTGYDTLFGSDHAARLRERFRRSLTTEFTTQDGRIVAIRSQLTGLSVPFLMPDEAVVSVLNPDFPDLAERYWAFVRRESMSTGSSGVALKLRDGLVDFGDNRPGPGSYLCSLAHAAHEMGDDEVFEAALEAMDEHCGQVIRGGARFYASASNLVNVGIPIARMLRKDFWRRSFVERPDPAALTGPALVGAAYPNVLVASAVSDGRNLNLVLYPGAGPQRVTLGVERLAPHTEYRVEGGLEPLIAADAAGTATMQVDLPHRVGVRMVPVT